MEDEEFDDFEEDGEMDFSDDEEDQFYNDFFQG